MKMADRLEVVIFIYPNCHPELVKDDFIYQSFTTTIRLLLPVLHRRDFKVTKVYCWQ
jgi:5-formyltetrahydrofolate cyclo-ligase